MAIDWTAISKLSESTSTTIAWALNGEARAKKAAEEAAAAAAAAEAAAAAAKKSTKKVSHLMHEFLSAPFSEQLFILIIVIPLISSFF